ncbi:FAD-dependent monooxygenase [Streptomyces sp. NPDC059193]|uniref:FAD-dependent monooxygenase n=1 Tax=Streptomyces sp. NPDC059193 TaxID=3346763 RepID=UPI0036873215
MNTATVSGPATDAAGDTGPDPLHVPVLVVGGSLSGLSAAVLLAHHGVECLVVERRSAIGTHPRSRVLTARSGEVLRSVGLEPAIDAVSRRPSGWFEARTLTDTAYTQLGPSDDPTLPISPAGSRLCDQNRLEPILLADAFTGRAGDGHVGLGTSLSEAVAVRRACRRLLERSLPGTAGTGWHPAGSAPYAEGPETADALGTALAAVTGAVLPPRMAGGPPLVPFVRDRTLPTSSAHLGRLVERLSARRHRVHAATIAVLPAGLVLSKVLLHPEPAQPSARSPRPSADRRTPAP